MLSCGLDGLLFFLLLLSYNMCVKHVLLFRYLKPVTSNSGRHQPHISVVCWSVFLECNRKLGQRFAQMVGHRVNPELTCPEHVQHIQSHKRLDNRSNFSYSAPDHKRGCFACEDTEKKLLLHHQHVGIRDHGNFVCAETGTSRLKRLSWRLPRKHKQRDCCSAKGGAAVWKRALLNINWMLHNDLLLTSDIYYRRNESMKAPPLQSYGSLEVQGNATIRLEDTQELCLCVCVCLCVVKIIWDLRSLPQSALMFWAHTHYDKHSDDCTLPSHWNTFFPPLTWVFYDMFWTVVHANISESTCMLMCT